jgi:hypothetical protein
VTDRVGGAESGTPSDQLGGGGATPTPALEKLRSSDWVVQPVSLITAAELVRFEHYAKGGPNTASYTHGLFRRGDFMDAQCRGVAWWKNVSRPAGLATYPENWNGVLGLTRLVVVPGVPKNAASFLLAHSRRMIDRKRWPCLVTWADTAEGHTGAIYRADNWEYMGLSAPEPMFRINGRMTARRAGPVTRTHAQMLVLGAERYMSQGKHKFRHLRPA